MINFKSRCETIRNSEKIMRMAKSVYPHYSGSMYEVRVNKQINKCKNENIKNKLSALRTKLYLRICNYRTQRGVDIDFFRDVIDMLKNKNIGNCFEDAILTEIIGKINGIKNIYTATISFNRNRSGKKFELDHVISLISQKPLDKGTEYQFRHKDAVVIDSWLGVTEFAEEYFSKLRNNFSNYFPFIPNDNIEVKRIASQSKTPQEFHEKKKDIFKPEFYVKIHERINLYNTNTQILKREFPELVMK